MTKVLSQDLIDDFFNNEVRRSIRISTNQNRKKRTKTMGVAIAAPRKRGKK
jgi:hypothetical protein